MLIDPVDNNQSFFFWTRIIKNSDLKKKLIYPTSNSRFQRSPWGFPCTQQKPLELPLPLTHTSLSFWWLLLWESGRLLLWAPKGRHRIFRPSSRNQLILESGLRSISDRLEVFVLLLLKVASNMELHIHFPCWCPLWLPSGRPRDASKIRILLFLRTVRETSSGRCEICNIATENGHSIIP